MAHLTVVATMASHWLVRTAKDEHKEARCQGLKNKYGELVDTCSIWTGAREREDKSETDRAAACRLSRRKSRCD